MKHKFLQCEIIWASGAQIDVEDFRVVTESYGMQLDDDSILALFSQVRVLPLQVLPEDFLYHIA